MDGGEMRYRESSHYYSTKFMRNSKAVGVLWGILSVCYAIIAIVVFMQVLLGITLIKTISDNSLWAAYQG